ncbi:MAG: GAF domain-containing protein [Planctomycetes bacterium]|nr:GAF domain-containing protein [Planctomycetota bacterium]
MSRSSWRLEESQDPGAEAMTRSGRYVPVVIGCAGVAGSLLLAGGLWFSERSAARAGFELEAMRLTDAAVSELQINLEQVRGLVALFQGSQVVEAPDFRTFTEQSFVRHPPLRALFWIEDSAGAAGARLVRMSEGPEAPDYPPGSALVTHAGLASVLAHARERGELTLSAPVERAGSARLIALAPVVAGVEWRGFVGGLFDVELLLAQAKRTPGAAEVFLSAEDSELAGVPLTRTSLAADAGSRYVEDLEFGGRRWHLSAAPPAGFLAAHRTWWPWIGLGFGLLATGLLLATVVMASGRMRILRLVEGRTQEVKQAYLTLSHEAKERMWAMSERRQLEQQLRAVIDLVPDRIFVKDALGRFLLANEATAEAYDTTVERLTAARHVDRNSTPLRPEKTLGEEQSAMQERRSVVLPALPFVDPQGRRRILHQVMIPCDVFGAQLGAMLCVATDITEQKQAEDVLRAHNRLLSALARGEDPERVLAQIVHAAEELVADMHCSVLLLASDGRHLRHGFAPSLPQEYNAAIDGLEIGPHVGSCGAAAALGERVVVADVMTHPNWEPYRALAQSSGIRACWSQPIRAADGALLGTFAMYYPAPRVPEPYEERFMEAMAHMAGIAIERSRFEAHL